MKQIYDDQNLGTVAGLRVGDAFDTPPRPPRLFDQIHTVRQVVTALVIRETKTRFGRSKFGFIWMLVEPAAFVLIFVAIRSYVSSTTPFGESIVLFILSGLIVVRMFLAITGGMNPAITSNKALLAYPPVKPVDVIIARFLLETSIMMILSLGFFGLLSLVTEVPVVVDQVAFTSALAAVLLLAGGIGTFNAVLSTIVPSWANIWGLLRLPLFILSGVFFVPSQLPPVAQEFLWWNPVLHCVEWLRTGTYMSYDTLLNRGYVLAVGAGSFTLGLVIERVYRFKLLSA